MTQPVTDSEVHIYQGEDPTEERPHARNYNGEKDVWVIECYDSRVIATMRAACVPEVGRGTEDEAMFRANTRQLLEFIAFQAGVYVEIRTRKKRTLTEEQKAKYRSMLAVAREKQGAN